MPRLTAIFAPHLTQNSAPGNNLAPQFSHKLIKYDSWILGVRFLVSNLLEVFFVRFTRATFCPQIAQNLALGRSLLPHFEQVDMFTINSCNK
jgi:hypothetical protein